MSLQRNEDDYEDYFVLSKLTIDGDLNMGTNAIIVGTSKSGNYTKIYSQTNYPMMDFICDGKKVHIGDQMFYITDTGGSNRLVEITKESITLAPVSQSNYLKLYHTNGFPMMDLIMNGKKTHLGDQVFYITTDNGTTQLTNITRKTITTGTVTQTG